MKRFRKERKLRKQLEDQLEMETKKIQALEAALRSLSYETLVQVRWSWSSRHARDVWQYLESSLLEFLLTIKIRTFVDKDPHWSHAMSILQLCKTSLDRLLTRAWCRWRRPSPGRRPAGSSTSWTWGSGRRGTGRGRTPSSCSPPRPPARTHQAAQVTSRAWDEGWRRFVKISQSRWRPQLGPSPGWKHLLTLSHPSLFRHYAKRALTHCK